MSAGLGSICLCTRSALRPWSRLSVQLTSMTSAWSQPAGPSCQLPLPPPMGGRGRRPGTAPLGSTGWQREGNPWLCTEDPLQAQAPDSIPPKGGSWQCLVEEWAKSRHWELWTIVLDKPLPLCAPGPTGGASGTRWPQRHPLRNATCSDLKW